MACRLHPNDGLLRKRGCSARGLTAGVLGLRLVLSVALVALRHQCDSDGPVCGGGGSALVACAGSYPRSYWIFPARRILRR